MSRHILSPIFLASFLCFACPVDRVAAEERILLFHSDIEVHADSTMTVMETIKVQVEGNKIEHGPYRDFPTKYKGRFGQTIRVGFDILQVKRDGQVEPYHIENQLNGERVYIGHEDRYLLPGEHTYELIYKTDHQLVYNKEFDELYWNVTGVDCDFPIVIASASVKLPETIPTKTVQLEGYTGSHRSKATDLTTQVKSGPLYTFTTTKSLRKQEGLTIVVTWPKGHVLEPTRAEKFKRVLALNTSGFVGLTGAFATLLYYVFVWTMAGRDPTKGTIIPQFEPPDGISPPAARFIREMGYDNKCMASAVVSLAVKNALKIEQYDSTYYVNRTGPPTSELTNEEKRVFNKLLGKRESLAFKQSNHRTIGAAVTALRTSLSRQFEKTYFLRNLKYWIPGIIIGVGTGIAVPLLSNNREDAMGYCAFFSIWSIATVALLSGVMVAWRNALFVDRKMASFGTAIFMTLFAMPFLATEGFLLHSLAISTSPIAALSLLGIGVLIWLFYTLMKAPTLLGRKIVDHLDGLHLYMSVAETDRLRMLHPPERTPEHFEELLPYALALNVEQEWGDRFADVLAKTTQAKSETGYQPAWYAGPNSNHLAAGAFAGTLGGAMASAIASSGTAPGSRSGSGGSGFSGGGGGGGGVGGW